MARVKRKNDYESFDKLMNRFKKLVERDNIVRTYCDKEFYEKPSATKKKAKALAIKRHQKVLRDENKKLHEMRLQSKK